VAVTFLPRWQFDVFLAAVVVGGLTVVRAFFPRWDGEIYLVRAPALLAFLLLSATLALGPLSRLWAPAKRLVFNRRHLGVTTWALACTHAGMVMHYGLGWHVRGLLEAAPEERAFGIPYPVLGVVALAILSAMALTSWDYFLHALGPVGWKRLHMAVYGAYGLVVLHVLTRLSSEKGPLSARAAIAFFGVVGAVAALHVAAALRERAADRAVVPPHATRVLLGRFSHLREGEAMPISLGAERIAICRMGGTLYGVSNVCPHQNGPLGEGRIRDGYLECPWHGYQFDPRTGQSPPGFPDSVPAYRLITEGDLTYLERPG
jgi:DMSO/TMAO reductase YedYZ heme-binding membrane subunit